MKNRQKVILDTDIGTDADDSMTLVQARGSSIELLGVTLGYGPTLLRKAIARHYTSAMGWDVPLHAGNPRPLSGKEIWLSGREGRTLVDLEIIENEFPTAVDFIAETLAKSVDPVTLLCVSPLTNIAEFLQKYPELHSKVDQLVVMGGEFEEGFAEHNFLSDSVAADVVMSSDLKITVVGLDATKRLRLDALVMDQIAASGRVGKILATEIYDWWDFWKEVWSVPHDPIALVALQHPELFEFSAAGQVTVQTSGAGEGRSTFKEGHGQTRYVTAYQLDRVSEKIISQIMSGCKNS